MELKAETTSIETTGQAKAEAQSRAEASRIQGKNRVEIAKLEAKAKEVSKFLPI